MQTHPHIAYVGDGMNDLAVCDLVTRFIGFGGFAFRQNVADQSDFYVKENSFAPIVALSLSLNEVAKLTEGERTLFNEGLLFIDNQNVLIN